jgi:hypothetical protein
MALLKNMFEIQHTTQPTPPVQNPEIDQRTAREWGVQHAGSVDGHYDALQPCLQAVYVRTKKRIEKDEVVQEQRRTEIKGNIVDLEARNKELDTKIRRETDNLKHEEAKIKKLQDEINNIRQRPQQITQDSFTKASFWIGAVIIMLLTVYLFIFYSSAAYSAFFKIFTFDDATIVNSIFDAQALLKAWQDGFTEMILILTIPAVFLGLGFLIHKFQEQKGRSRHLKIAGLVATTFVFDFILAYEITKKLHNIQVQGSFDNTLQEMSIGLAFQKVEFWLIIFAGFVVYLIWGFVFDFVMKEYEKLDRINYAIKTKEKKIAEYKIECKAIKDRIGPLEAEKTRVTGKINRLRVELNGVITYFNDVKGDINDFFAGWIAYMQGAGKKHTEITKCTTIKDDYLLVLQNTVYTAQSVPSIVNS